MIDKDKIRIFLEDDNEILGNGAGDPYKLQYLNTKEYIKVLVSNNIKSTFFIDMGHYIFLKKNLNKSEKCKNYLNSIEKTVEILLENKMDVQLHIHTQWQNASVYNNLFKVTNNWNLGMLSNENQSDLLNETYNSLSNILKKFNCDNEINSYKAGSWGLQPFKNIHKILKDKKIKILLGPASDIKSKRMKIDYTTIKSSISPYFPNPENINDIGIKDNLFIIPITPTHLNWFDLIRYFLEKKIEKISNLKSSLSGDYSQMKLENKINLTFNKFNTHMKINSHRYWYLKKTFERSFNNVVKNNFNYKIVVIETHTKDFKKNLKDIDKFFKYVIKNYKNIEFVTSRQILSDFDKKKFIPLHINEK